MCAPWLTSVIIPASRWHIGGTGRADRGQRALVPADRHQHGSRGRVPEDRDMLPAVLDLIEQRAEGTSRLIALDLPSHDRECNPCRTTLARLQSQAPEPNLLSGRCSQPTDDDGSRYARNNPYLPNLREDGHRYPEADPARHGHGRLADDRPGPRRMRGMPRSTQQPRLRDRGCQARRTRGLDPHATRITDAHCTATAPGRIIRLQSEV